MTTFGPALGEVPFIKVKRVRENQQQGSVEADFLLDLKIKDGPSRQIVVEAKANGRPRLAREAINQLLRYRSKFPEAYGVFMAPYISPESAGVFAKEGVGYLDLAGNCRLSFGQVFIRERVFATHLPRSATCGRCTPRNPRGCCACC